MTGPRTGAEALCDALERENVDCVFGLPGTQTVEIYEALRTSKVRSIVPTHETAASFMANGYARASGKPGVLLTISGPGVAFAPPGLAEAKLDAVPLVHLTISPATGPTGAPSFQAFDQAAFARPIVKATLRVDHREQLGGAVREAFAFATARDAGPVFVEFSPHVLRERDTDLSRAHFTGTAPHGAGDARSLDAIVELLSSARRPVLFVACDASSDADLMASVAASARLPVLVPAQHRGTVPEDNAWTLCCDDQRTPFPLIQEVVAAADLVVVLGTRLSHVATAGFRLSLIPERVVCVSDTGEALPHGYSARAIATSAPREFLNRVAAAASRFASTWSEPEVAQWRQRFAAEQPSDPPEPIVDGGTPAAFFASMRASLPRDAILVTDSGLHQVLARRHYQVLSPRGFLFPSDLQSMGFGLPAAIGAKIGAPARAVVVVMGDGGFLMTGLELVTAAREGIRVIVVVFNDGQLNLIRLQQLKEFGRASGVDLVVPDLARFAESVGVRYLAVSGDIGTALREALAADTTGPTLIEVAVGDSRSITGVRAKSLARETVRKAIGPRAVDWIKKLR